MAKQKVNVVSELSPALSKRDPDFEDIFTFDPNRECYKTKPGFTITDSWVKDDVVHCVVLVDMPVQFVNVTITIK
jgi:hypothetical protein